MTERTALLESRIAGLPQSWWARGLALCERLAAPGAPTVDRAARLRLDALRTVPWASAHADGLAARLTALGLGDELARALGEEQPERLAARTAKPRWAETVERALERAPESPDGAAQVRQHDGAEVFVPVLRPLIAQAWAEVEERLALPAEEHGVVRAAFERRLGARLARLAARTLVTELHRARRAGELSGTTSRERFTSFVAELGTCAGLTRLFAAYPVLARLLGQSCADAAEATAELTDRLHRDRKDLVADLFHGVDPGPLTGLELGLGDAHQGGRSVAVVTFADGSRAVCKPRPLDQHALLDELVDWLDDKAPALGLRTARTLRRPGYGWVEFVEHRFCADTAEADRFYRRQGALLALLYAVDGADMHYENVIASGDQPILVDAETLLHGGLPQATTAGHDPAADALQASVQRTCLLPTLLIGDQGALDISALGRVDSGAYPSACLRWEQAGTDLMRAVRGTVDSTAAQNQPLPQGLAAAPTDHRAALLAGFRLGYDAVADHRDELLADDGPLARWADAPARLIVRATRLYATLLEESTHPDLLRDALSRDAVFAVLWTESAQDPSRQRLVEHEIADLWRGDVPLFTHRPDRTAVWSSAGAGVDAILPEPALTAVRAKIAAMGEVDRHDQEWVIAASLAVSAGPAEKDGPRSRLLASAIPAPVPPTRGRLLAAACGVADELVARAVHAGDRANWLGLERVVGDHWAVLPMGAGLAQGYTGVALFLARTGRVVGADRYLDLARAVLRPLPALLRALALDPELSQAAGPGALDGLGGIVQALVALRGLLGSDAASADALSGDGDSFDDCLALALTALGHAALGDAVFGGVADGVAGGLAGALAAAVAAWQATGSPQAATLAGTLADTLLARAVAPGSAGTAPGFAEGDAGIGWALLRYAAAAERGASGAVTPGAAGVRPAEAAREALRHAVAASGADAQSEPGAGAAPSASGAVAMAVSARSSSAALETSRPGARHREVGRALLGSALADVLGRADGDGSWYSGLPGVALAAVDAGLPVADADALAAAVDAALDGLPGRDQSLGRGASGALEALSLLADRGSRTARTALERRTGELLGSVELLGPRCGTPDQVPTPGLLNGLAGIGHGLLRLACPADVSSPLLF
ncbi:type 2 lanthipeptide synthetase LanM family protein [Streptacidiphilus jiangxiensis]|uniref:type 2 lanthipeptide synthetase LanM family protein n=1 Tax=Streptacidiphilus jiangxiensis TaxID=235985 RepID=UPI0005A9CED7|nr:type 2 lanthipeptide synthetase LanM family protein [Streptacidiphilus jiangxiensis]